MHFEFLGHAAILLSRPDGTLLIDPYDTPAFDGKFRYRPIDARPDWVVSTHAHVDHAAYHVVPHAELVESGTAGPFEISRVSLWHDEYRGRRRGGASDALKILVDTYVIVHLGDVGCSPPPEVIDSLRNPDVLFVPVGGFFTIGAAQAWEWVERLAPRCAVPIHYRTGACSLPLRGPESFLAWAGEWKEGISGPISVQKGLDRTVRIEPSKT